MTDTSLLSSARRIADEVLFPAAEQVEASGVVPREHLDLLAAQGLYGVYSDIDGQDVPDAHLIAEALASGCLSTALVWIQHQAAVRAVRDSGRPGVRDTWLTRLSTGEIRAGTAIGALRPGPASLRVRSVPGGRILDGSAPWVTGWGLIDVLYTAARDENDVIVWTLVDAQESATLRMSSLDLLAVMPSRTVELKFDNHFVADDRVTGTLPFAEWPERDAAGLRGNGGLALGLADRCIDLLGDRHVNRAAALAWERDRCRTDLDRATPGTLPAARASASEFAFRCAGTLVAAVGARAVLAGETAQRLLREATFLLVFASRPEIKAALVDGLAQSRTGDRRVD